MSYIFKAIFIVPKFSIQASTLSFQWQDLRFKRPALAVSFVKATSSSLAGRKITGHGMVNYRGASEKSWGGS